MSTAKKSYSLKKPFLKKKKCKFCMEKTEPTYRKPEVLKAYTTEKGKILPAILTGNCAKHQRATAREIKRARMLALLPFTV